MKALGMALAVGLAVLLTAGEGRADFLTGQELNEELCSFPQGCHGYVMGVYDSGEILDEATDKRQWRGGWTACVPEGPEGVKAVQLTEVVTKWLREHPENWHYSAAGLVAEAFQDAFPCPD